MKNWYNEEYSFKITVLSIKPDNEPLNHWMGIEKSLYIPSYAMLKCMLGWAKNYNSGKGELHDRIKPYQDKLIILHNHKEINKFISETSVKL